MKEYQEKEMSDLSKQYEDFLQEVITLQETVCAPISTYIICSQSSFTVI